MGSKGTKQQIEDAIYALTAGGEPFCTAGEIAEYTDLSKVAVNKNIGEVVEDVRAIKTRTAGQTPVYYVKHVRLDDLPHGRDVFEVGQCRASPRTPAQYYLLRDAGEDSDFDFVVEWFDRQTDELEDYRPTMEEIGQVASSTAPEPVAIKYHDRQEDEVLEAEENE